MDGAGETGFLEGRDRIAEVNRNLRCDFLAASGQRQVGHVLRVDRHRSSGGERQDPQFRFVGQVVQHQPPRGAANVFPVVPFIHRRAAIQRQDVARLPRLLVPENS